MPDGEFLRASYVTYFEAGALVKFLIERHGIERFRTMTNWTESPEELETTISSVYGRTVEELDADWHTYLLEQEYPRSTSKIPAGRLLAFLNGRPGW